MGPIGIKQLAKNRLYQGNLCQNVVLCFEFWTKVDGLVQKYVSTSFFHKLVMIIMVACKTSVTTDAICEKCKHLENALLPLPDFHARDSNLSVEDFYHV